MDTLGDLFDRGRRSEAPALAEVGGRAPSGTATGRTYDYHWLCTSAWKAGNYLRHVGVRRGVAVGIVGDGAPALLAFFGTALLEGTARFEPPRNLADATDLRALVAPVGDLDAYDLPRGAQRVGYGGEPDDPAVHEFDAGLWSENPSFPPVEIEPETALLSDGERSWSHAEALAAARTVVDDADLDAGSRVALRDGPSDPRVVVAGVIAPLLVGATVILPAGAGAPESDGDDRVDVAVGSAGARVEQADARIEQADVRIEPADVERPGREPR